MSFRFWRRKRDEELDDEIESHLQMAAREHVERGESFKQAEISARRELGNVGLVKEVTRDVRGWRWVGDIARDARFGLRMLGKNPGFTAVAVMTLALGIGANAALFSVIDSVVFRTLPVAHVSELVDVGSSATKQAPAGPGVSWPAYVEYRDLSSSPFSGLAAYTDRVQVTLAQEDAAGRPSTAAAVTGNYFDLLGVRAARGRLIEPGDDTTGGSDAVVLSYRYWESEFAARPEAIGATLRINGAPYVIVGVTPKDFFGIGLNNIPEIWLPMSSAIRIEPIYRTQMQLPGNPFFRVVGRMKPAVTLEQARQQMQVEGEQLGAGKTRTYIYPFTGAGGRKVSDPFERPFPLLVPIADLAGQRWKELSACWAE